ncbi:MAG: fatty acid desaturase, partial [Phycisphaerae bacterium]
MPLSMTPTALATPTPPVSTSLKFTGSDRFLRELRQRVDTYFETTGRHRRDCPSMYFKTATILVWFFGAYFLLLFAVHSWWLVLPLAIILGLGLAAIGFNIQHDGGHQGYSEKRWINKMMALTLDLMGGSSYLWDWKHNTIHHTYTNITGVDDDIDLGFLARLSPHQPRFWFHRLQGVYLWGLYGFLAIKWHLFDDFYQLAVGRIGVVLRGGRAAAEEAVGSEDGAGVAAAEVDAEKEPEGCCGDGQEGAHEMLRGGVAAGLPYLDGSKQRAGKRTTDLP